MSILSTGASPVRRRRWGKHEGCHGYKLAITLIDRHLGIPGHMAWSSPKAKLVIAIYKSTQFITGAQCLRYKNTDTVPSFLPNDGQNWWNGRAALFLVTNWANKPRQQSLRSLMQERCSKEDDDKYIKFFLQLPVSCSCLVSSAY